MLFPFPHSIFHDIHIHFLYDRKWPLAEALNWLLFFTDLPVCLCVKLAHGLHRSLGCCSLLQKVKICIHQSITSQHECKVCLHVTGSDSKSSPDTGSEKAGSVGELGGSIYNKRVQLRR